MDIRKLQRAIVDGLEDVKGQNIVVFNTEALSPLFERVIIASGTSNRQTKALAASVRDAVKALGEPVPRVEGEDNGEWIIVDCGAAVAHIMQPAIRDYYHLEEIWGVKPVTLRAAARRTGLPKAEEPPAPARKTAATRSAPRRAEAPVAAAGSGEPAAKTRRRTASPAATRTGRSPSAAPASPEATARRRAAPSKRAAGSASAPVKAAEAAAKPPRKRVAKA